MSTVDIDELVNATPDTRERAVDFLRAFSILVVVLWHWVFSVTHWNAHGALTMPNPIGHVPALWVTTWVLQIMPLFFFVGGFANFVAYRAHIHKGEKPGAFVTSRVRRLLAPIGMMLAAWTAFDLLAAASRPGARSVLQWGFVVFVPLWFLGVYVAVVALVPLTMRLHERAPVRALVTLGAAVIVVDVIRFASGIEAIGFVNVLAVFAFVHQLGYWYGDGTLARASRRTHLCMVVGAVFGLMLLTTFGPYPVSMVTVASEQGSNMLPPTMCIAVLGVLQAGLAMLLRPMLNRWLQRRRPWKVVVAANAVSMTVFTWHMTAYVMAVGVMRIAGHELLARPTAAWWLERPLWLLLPGACLAVLVKLFAGVEVRSRQVAPRTTAAATSQ
jgi:hypothetical protein